MRVTPINCAETIIEPFWDPQLSGLAEWSVEPGDRHGLEVKQGWCFATFAWQAKPAAGPSARAMAITVSACLMRTSLGRTEPAARSGLTRETWRPPISRTWMR